MPEAKPKSFFPIWRAAMACSYICGTAIMGNVELLQQYHVKQSFSAMVKPHDNDAAKAFFATFKREEAYRKIIHRDSILEKV